MSVGYRAVGWNRQKRIYDALVVGGIVGYLALFIALGVTLFPEATLETILLRALGTCALLLLHIVLSIGPLARLDSRFLPWLYNRRHIGVATFLVGLAHSVFALIQFHALGDENPLVSVLVSNTRWNSISSFPFQQLGLAALVWWSLPGEHPPASLDEMHALRLIAMKPAEDDDPSFCP